jgi:protocatechuate 3,4-dioxygenase beta subunit
MRDELEDEIPHRVPRREALRLLGGLGAAAAGLSLAACGDDGSAAGATTAVAATEATAATACILSPEVTEGPYWIDGTLTRRNITEGRPGLPLLLDLQVVDAKTCSPIPKADVELWHCDAAGVYSGFEAASTGGPPGGGGATDETRYLRGHQRADASGHARFVTIYPGWYRGRTPHIHLKVHVGGDVVHTGQVFMSERITARVYRQAPYRANGPADTSHAADMIYAQAGGARSQLKLARRTEGRRGYRGTIVLGVAT